MRRRRDDEEIERKLRKELSDSSMESPPPPPPPAASSSAPPIPYSLSLWDYLNFLILRPALAVTFALSFILLWWWLAWKLVLSHVPLVQEMFGLRKKPVQPKPPTGRLSRYYNSINARNASSW